MSRAKITRIDRLLVIAMWGGACAYCRADLAPDEEHLDHILPIARGGTHVLANMALACGPCNLRKGRRTATEIGKPDVPTRALLLEGLVVDHLRAGVFDAKPTSFWTGGSPLACAAVLP